MSGDVVSLEGRRFLVTGATGFLGSAFVRHAVSQGAHVTVVDRQGSNHFRLDAVRGCYARCTTSLAGLREGPAASLGAQVLVHFAAAGVDQTFDNADALVETNVEGTLHTLTAARRLGVERFVLVGSSGEYGPGTRIEEGHALAPTSEYGATRAAASLLARTYGARRGLDVVIVRPFAVYGEFEPAYRLVPYCTMRGLRGEPIKISSGVQTRDYVHVDDIARGIACASVLESARGGTFNLCTGHDTSVRDAASLVAELTGGRSPLDVGVRDPIPGEMWQTSGSPRAAQAVLGWTASLDLRRGLARTVQWFEEEGMHLAAYADTP